jgi:hypothetical protein
MEPTKQVDDILLAYVSLKDVSQYLPAIHIHDRQQVEPPIFPVNPHVLDVQAEIFHRP